MELETTTNIPDISYPSNSFSFIFYFFVILFSTKKISNDRLWKVFVQLDCDIPELVFRRAEITNFNP